MAGDMIKKYYFYFFIFLIFIKAQSTDLCSLQNECGTPLSTLFLPLSITQNLYTQYHKYSPNMVNLSATYRFVQAYNNNEIIQSVLHYNPIVFMGADVNVDNRPANALIAEYFGLAPDTYASLDLHPQIRNQVIDVQLAMQSKNAWFQVNLPLVKAQWKVNINPINNSYTGTKLLQEKGNIYIYNMGTTMNTTISTLKPLPPDGSLDEGGYNVLPPNNTGFATVGDYNGAYIASTEDASQENTYEGQSIFTSESLNQGYSDFNDTMEENFNINNTFSENNWVVGLGQWPVVNYTPYLYQAAYTTVDDQGVSQIVPAAMFFDDPISLSGEMTNASDYGNNVLQITQKELEPALNLVNALDGSYDFNGLLKRKYGNINLNSDTSIENWQIGDIILWLGYDISRCGVNHIGLYLHGVIPTGTLIDEAWSQYLFNPVVGNGHHGQLGVGFSGAYLFCQEKCYNITCNFNGYIDHVFATKQFRTFDINNQPLSRYAIVKALKYKGFSELDAFNDDFEYQYLTTVGNVNGVTIEVSNDVKGEFIVDFSYDTDRFSGGIGYAFSGMTCDKLNCNLDSDNLPKINFIQDQIYYGYKGNTPISSLIMINITSQQEKVTPSSECSASQQNACTYPLAYQFQNEPQGIFPSNVPFGNIILVKSSGDVTIGGNSGMYNYGTSTGLEDSVGDAYYGTTESDVFSLPNIAGNRSGLLGGQILNRIFGHADFTWESSYLPTIGIVGSYGFGSSQYFTPLYWDAGFYIGLSF